MFTIISRRVITHSSLRRHFAKAAVVPSDEVIAQQAHLRPIREIAETILSDEDLERLEPYGKYKAKIPIDLLRVWGRIGKVSLEIWTLRKRS